MRLIFLRLIAVGLFCLATGSSEAHHQRLNLDTSGTSIPNLTHGQLKIVAQYHSAILDLADRQVSPSLVARALQNYVNLQYAYCLWGLVPGSITEEDSPFNECSHAYLAASKALLDELVHSAIVKPDAEALAGKIDLEMLADNSALQMCRNSLQPFNTAQVIMPEWRSIAFNPLEILLAS